MASFKAKFPVLQELFAKNHRGGPFGPPPPAGRGLNWPFFVHIYKFENLTFFDLTLTFPSLKTSKNGLRRPN